MLLQPRHSPAGPRGLYFLPAANLQIIKRMRSSRHNRASNFRGEIEIWSVHLKQGDMIVQQATNQGWVNHGSEPCRILFVLMDSQEP